MTPQCVDKKTRFSRVFFISYPTYYFDCNIVFVNLQHPVYYKISQTFKGFFVNIYQTIFVKTYFHPFHTSG